MGWLDGIRYQARWIASILILAAAVTISLPFAAAQANCVEAGGLCFTPPEGYAPDSAETKGGVTFHTLIKLGGRAALNATLPTHKFDASYIDNWLKGDAYRMLKVAVIDLGEHDAAAPMSELAARFHNGFASRWGRYAFATFDPATQIGHSVNVSGAFVAGHVARCGAKFVIIEAMDVVEFLKLSNADFAGAISGDDSDRWMATRPAANTDDAEQLIANICKAAA